jgi:Arc/MetJ-type ribon-helix-helix transcriptional regulator
LAQEGIELPEGMEAWIKELVKGGRS